MAKMISGVIGSRDLAERAINRLEDFGYNAKDISIITKDSPEAGEIKDNTGASVTKQYEDSIRQGAILLAVPVRSDEEEEVSGILENYGATQIRRLEVDRREKEMFPERQSYEEEAYYSGAKGGEAGEDLEEDEHAKRRSRRGRIL